MGRVGDIRGAADHRRDVRRRMDLLCSASKQGSPGVGVDVEAFGSRWGVLCVLSRSLVAQGLVHQAETNDITTMCLDKNRMRGETKDGRLWEVARSNTVDGSASHHLPRLQYDARRNSQKLGQVLAQPEKQPRRKYGATIKLLPVRTRYPVGNLCCCKAIEGRGALARARESERWICELRYG